MSFTSILFENAENAFDEELAEPSFFQDLHLDQIVAAITDEKKEYNLKSFFYVTLKNLETVNYRHQIFQELENSLVKHVINVFAQNMQAMRGKIEQANKLKVNLQKQSWFLDAVVIYCDAVNGLVNELKTIDLQSKGFLAFRDYLITYANSSHFKQLSEEVKSLKTDLSNIRYCLHITGSGFKVSKYASEEDFTKEVEKTFEKFKSNDTRDFKNNDSKSLEMNRIEEKVIEFVSQLYSDIFLHLSQFCERNRDFLDKTITTFDREIQFYITYLDFVGTFKQAGLKICYPRLSQDTKEIVNEEGFDLALANKLLKEHKPLVCNDFFLTDKERVFIISGPNQGGKTTFGRTFGQLHYLANLGCPVQGRKANLFLFDKIFTHFEKEENIQDLRGKLEDDLVRLHEILEEATPNSLIIMNEIFTSTTLKDAIFLGKKLMEKIIQLDALCVCVTFIEELAFMGEKIVSMVSTVVPENPVLRTYKILRKPPDGIAHAVLMAEKYGLTYNRLRERIKE